MPKNQAQNVALVSGVIGLIVMATLLYVGNIITFKVSNSMPSTTTSATATQDNITSNLNSAWSLSSVAPLVAGAALILTVILGFAAVVGRQS